MKYETAKSIVLGVLVAVSLVLTWNLWTYQPTYDFIDKKYTQEVAIAGQMDASKLVRPSKVLLHKDGEHYSTVRETEITEMLVDIGTWSFYNLSEPKSLTKVQIESISHADNSVEILFPDRVPLELYKGMIHFETKETPVIQFDRIVISLDGEKKGETNVQFVSSQDRVVYGSHINMDKLSAFRKKVLMEQSHFEKCASYQLPDGRRLFLPDGETRMTQYKYYSDYIDSDKFKNALFNDPSFVRKDVLPNGEKYTDGLSLLTINQALNSISYVNPTQETERDIDANPADLLKRSIDFVNSHGGWTDNYRYFEMNKYEYSTVFRLFMKGYPVFNGDGMSEIRERWGEQEIYKYDRPNYVLDLSLSSSEVVLPSPQAVLDHLMANPDFQPDMLQDITLGYKLQNDPKLAKVLVFQPSWYYRYAGSWMPLGDEEIGGMHRGLEQN